MNTTTSIIITDTNIITDLENAKILEIYVNLNNVYICDMVKNNEINLKTCNSITINKFKTIDANSTQLKEVIEIKSQNKKLSSCDIINYILARDNNYILATGDNRLKSFAESHNVNVIRTLRVIEIMYENKYIDKDCVINACINLKNNRKTRIPEDDIDKFMGKIKSRE